MMDTSQEMMNADNGTIALLNRGEIDMQIATAHKYPRSIVAFRNEVLQMVTLNEKVAGECVYALPRDGKTIEGPSARFAEVVASAWGNSRAGARVVSDAGEFVTAQGVFHDLQRNVAITYEVQRRITNNSGQRFKADMIGMTANAACSIALRNAILKGVPKAFWSDMYDAARQTIMGDIKTLANRRADMLAACVRFGATNEQVFAKLGIAGIEDVTLENLVTLRGLLTAIKEGDTTTEMAFSVQASAAPVTAPRSKSEAAKPVEKEVVMQAEASKAAEASAKAAAQPVAKLAVQPTAASLADQKTGELPLGTLVTASQIRWAKTKVSSLELSDEFVADMLRRAGADSMDSLNLDQFDLVRSELIAAGA